MNKVCCGPGYASPIEAINAPREKLLYTIAIYTGTGIQKPDYLATVDVDPDSPTYSQVIHRLEMPGIGDELHHMGWNACSSCHDDSSMSRKYLILPGVRSNNLHIVDTATDPKAPRLYKVIEGAEIKSKADLSGPHTVHCLGSEIIISFLGNAKGEAPGGYLQLDKNCTIRVRSSISSTGINDTLTIKGPSNSSGMSRYEFETKISNEDTINLFKICHKPIIEKTRHIYLSLIHI